MMLKKKRSLSDLPRTKRGKKEMSALILIGSGGWSRTICLKLMRLASRRCSTPQYYGLNHIKDLAIVLGKKLRDEKRQVVKNETFLIAV